jgi:hypothetical protein
MPIQVCKICPTKFYAKPNWIKRGWGIYCSVRCHHLGTKKGKNVKCFICNKLIYRPLRSLKNSKSKKYFCSKSCQTKWRNTEFIGSKHANWRHGRACYKSILSRNGVTKKCVLCNTLDMRVLAVHHVDENHSNNVLENLSWLCHNCHHLVHYDSVEKQRFLELLRK